MIIKTQNIMKDAKYRLFKKQNKPIQLYACLSKITQNALIGQKVNNGDSCCTSVSFTHKSKQRHAEHSYRRILEYYSLHKTEVSLYKKLCDIQNKLKRQILNPSGDKSPPRLKSSDKSPNWLRLEIKVRNLTNTFYLKTKNNVAQIRNLKHRALAGTSMGKTSKSDNDEGQKARKRGHKDLKKRAKTSARNSTNGTRRR